MISLHCVVTLVSTNKRGSLNAVVCKHHFARQLQETARKYNEDYVKKKYGPQEAQEEANLFGSLGWTSDANDEGGGISEQRLNALLKRVRVLKIVDEEMQQAIEGAADEDKDPRIEEVRFVAACLHRNTLHGVTTDNLCCRAASSARRGELGCWQFAVELRCVRVLFGRNDGLEQLEAQSGEPGTLEKVVEVLKHSLHEDLGKVRDACLAESHVR